MSDTFAGETTTTTGLPTLVSRYLERALPAGGVVPRLVRIAQTGGMWRQPRVRPLRFTAVEELAVAEIGFTWRGRFPLLPLLSLRIDDRYESGEGRLEGRLAGFVPVLKATGDDIDEGEATRYLSELPWVPHALEANRQLEWREVGPLAVEVAARIGTRRIAVRLEFDADGDIVGTFADARPRREGKTSVPTPWGGRFSDYRELGGIRVPTRAEVRWELPGGPFTYWRGTITSLELVPQGDPTASTTRS